MAPYSLQGKTLFITGGGSGIGAETARQAVRRGARVALVDVDIDAANRVAAELNGASLAIEADVRDYDSLVAAVNKTVETFGGIDVAYANAGIELDGTARGASLRDIERISDINFTGVMRTAKAVIPQLIERRGYLLITASMAAIVHAPPLSHYSATKAGVEAFGNSVRAELKHLGVGVGVAYFAVIDTPMVQRAYDEPIIAQVKAEGPDTFLTKTYPVSGAAAAVVDGMEARARRVMYPPWLHAFHYIRAIAPRLVELTVRRRPFKDMVDRMDARDLPRGEDATQLKPEQERLLS